MNGFVRFISIGRRAIDERVARVLAPPPLHAADRYLQESAIVRAIDRATIVVFDMWHHSRTAEVFNKYGVGSAHADWPARYRLIGILLSTAIVVHLGLTLAVGARPAWFWLVIPSLAAVIAAVLLAAASAAKR